MPPDLLMCDCCVHDTFCVGYGSDCCHASLVLNEPTFRRHYRAAVRHEPSLRDSNPTTKPTVPIPTQPLRDPQPSAPSTSATPFPPRFFMNCSKGACLGGRGGDVGSFWGARSPVREAAELRGRPSPAHCGPPRACPRRPGPAPQRRPLLQRRRCLLLRGLGREDGAVPRPQVLPEGAGLGARGLHRLGRGLVLLRLRGGAVCV